MQHIVGWHPHLISDFERRWSREPAICSLLPWQVAPECPEEDDARFRRRPGHLEVQIFLVSQSERSVTFLSAQNWSSGAITSAATQTIRCVANHLAWGLA